MSTSNRDFPNALPEGYRLHEYELLRTLGAGGFGVIYLAFDHHLDKAVAIKEYLPKDLAVRVESTSVHPNTLARIDHPSIIRVMRFFEANDFNGAWKWIGSGGH